MNAYACVYRHQPATDRERELTATSPHASDLVREFLAEYEESYLDWGDDPSFFAAKRILGDERRSSWGVCRPDVRDALHDDGFVVFFTEVVEQNRSEYYWAGLGSVARLVRNRQLVWTDPDLAPYRRFFNLLVTSTGAHREYFHPPHKNDWERRRDAPYVVFDADLSRFDLEHPLHVSTYDARDDVPDRWKRDDPTVRTLERLLFGERKRRLRTSHTGFGHAKLRLGGTPEELTNLRTKLIALFDARRREATPRPPRGTPAPSSRRGGCA